MGPSPELRAVAQPEELRSEPRNEVSEDRGCWPAFFRICNTHCMFLNPSLVLAKENLTSDLPGPILTWDLTNKFTSNCWPIRSLVAL